MTLSKKPEKESFISQSPKISKPKQFSVEVIEALTPIFLALIGGLIGMVVLVAEADPAGLGLASTAIAGAAGLAQPYKNQDRNG